MLVRHLAFGSCELDSSSPSVKASTLAFMPPRFSSLSPDSPGHSRNGLHSLSYVSLLSVTPFSSYRHLLPIQLAEAILTEDSDMHDGRPIVLSDTRTSSHNREFDADEHERQFLVGKDDDDDEDQHEHESGHGHEHDLQDEVQSFRSSVSMDGSDRGREADDSRRSHLRNLSASMVNDEARTSHLDLQNLSLHDEDDYVSVEDRAHSSSLAGKAGIIIVGVDYLPSFTHSMLIC